MHWAPLALHLAEQRRALPEMTFGRGIDGFSYITSAELRAGRTVAELFGDLVKTNSEQAHRLLLRRPSLWR
jgi:hypothetical protein